jgi:hypothetical protein
MSAIVARLPQPEVNLAAYGGVVFPLALIIESPIIMLLSASTALCKDWGSYLKVYRFMMVASAVMTFVHILIAFTSLRPGGSGHTRCAFRNCRAGSPGTPHHASWTWSIAYRQFHQGILIRFNHARKVGSDFHCLACNLTVL